MNGQLVTCSSGRNRYACPQRTCGEGPDAPNVSARTFCMLSMATARRNFSAESRTTEVSCSRDNGATLELRPSHAGRRKHYGDDNLASWAIRARADGLRLWSYEAWSASARP